MLQSHPRRCEAACLYPLSPAALKSVPLLGTHSCRQRRARLGWESDNVSPGPSQGPVCFFFAFTQRSWTDPHPSLATSMTRSDHASGLRRRALARKTRLRYVVIAPVPQYREEVVAACRVALMHEFVCDLPDGYDTMLGNGGTNLSGGQKQQLAIARAYLRDPTVLILGTFQFREISRLL